MAEKNPIQARKSVSKLDAFVGRRIRERRIQRSTTLSAIAQHLGLTFQQVQKYEKGTNRVSASRLAEIAKVLDVPVTFFFPPENATEIPPTVCERYPNCVRAAQALTEAAAALLQAVGREDPIPVQRILPRLVDAAIIVAEIEARLEDTELLVALHRWNEAKALTEKPPRPKSNRT